MPLHVKWAAVTMNRTVGKILIGLYPFHRWQAFLIAPIGIAELHPVVEIGFHRAQHRHHINGRAAAHDLAGKSVIGAASTCLSLGYIRTKSDSSNRRVCFAASATRSGN